MNDLQLLISNTRQIFYLSIFKQVLLQPKLNNMFEVPYCYSLDDNVSHRMCLKPPLTEAFYLYMYNCIPNCRFSVMNLFVDSNKQLSLIPFFPYQTWFMRSSNSKLVCKPYCHDFWICFVFIFERVRVMVFNATLNNISVILWR